MEDKEQSTRTKDKQFEEGKEQVYICTCCPQCLSTAVICILYRDVVLVKEFSQLRSNVYCLCNGGFIKKTLFVAYNVEHLMCLTCVCR